MKIILKSGNSSKIVLGKKIQKIIINTNQPLIIKKK